MTRLKIEAFSRERERESSRAFGHSYYDIISIENLLAAWQEFLCGKRKRADVIEFSIHFLDNIASLHRDLVHKTYRHGGYHAFKINDPKPRDIHKASVRDRLLHHAMYRKLYPYFDQQFIFDSYSCRDNKGTHRAINRFREYGRIVSHNHTRTVWVLKCDIKRFFASIDQTILQKILANHIQDQDVLWLLGQVIGSFKHGLPLGNLTSQLLVNIYMNEFDQWMKRKIKAHYYIRYADDFVVLHDNREYLLDLVPSIANFLDRRLRLTLHPNKLFIKTFASGVDFLGWVHFRHHRVLRTATKRRMRLKLSNGETSGVSWISYKGMLSHGNTYKLQQLIEMSDML